MKKDCLYFIDLQFPKLFAGADKYLASSKAREDIKTILLQRSGVQYVPIRRNFRSKIIGNFELLIKLFCKLLLINKGADLFFQYPMGSLSVFRLLSPLFLRLNTTIIVHDLPSFRFEEEYRNRSKEINLFNHFSSVIVHSENMKLQLMKYGVTSNLIVLSAFDYLLDDKKKARKEENAIVFAGDLKKSVFLNDLHTINLEGIHFHLYGGFKPNLEYSNKIIYKGVFAPDDISSIEGEWGLLWDGNSVKECAGNFGEYLTIIAPHKFSLYLACGFKVIAWEGSAMADFIVKERIGFTITNLSEICEKIFSFSDEERKEMSANVQKWSDKVRSGAMFLTAFKQV